jgi:hypothetical protein
MLAHMKGHEENVLVGTQIQSQRMRGPLDEAPKNASYWPPFVLLCPSLCLLWAALTWLVDFALEI